MPKGFRKDGTKLGFQLGVLIGTKNPATRESVKRKISDSLKGRPAWNKGISNPSICGDKNPAKRKEVREKISKALKGRTNYWMLGKKNVSYGKTFYPKRRFCEELNHHIRSSWEEYVGKILLKNDIKYDYEGIRFEVFENKTYTPDFIIGNIIIEVKGPIFDWQLKKYKRFMEEYPQYFFFILTTSNQIKYIQTFGLNCFDIDKPNEWIKVIKDGR